jgi:Mce-associated membrane protein
MEEPTMPPSGDRRLRLVKGAPPAAGGPAPARSVARRTVTRRVPPSTDPVAAILERLDEEPVEAGDATLGSPPAGPVRSDPARSGPDSNDPDADDPDADDPGASNPDPAGGADRRHGRGRAGDGTAGGEYPAGGAPVAARTRRLRGLRLARPALGGRPLAMTALVVALCAALVAAGVFGRQWYHDRALDQAHQRAVAAARQTTVNFVSISASSVDRDLQRIVNGASGDFKDQFTRGQAQVRAAVVENNVESHGSVLRAGLVSGDLRTAVVLVAIDATVKNTNAPQGKASHYRIQLDMINRSGTWLVSRLQFVG